MSGAKVEMMPFGFSIDSDGNKYVQVEYILPVLRNPEEYCGELLCQTIRDLSDESFDELLDCLQSKAKWTESEIKELCDFRIKFKENRKMTKWEFVDKIKELFGVSKLGQYQLQAVEQLYDEIFDAAYDDGMEDGYNAK